MSDFDVIDRKILRIIQEDATLSLQIISDRVGLSVSACSRRIKNYEETGIIDKRVTLLNANMINRSTVIFIEISLETQSEHLLSAFEDAIKNIPEIMECYLMGGNCDYLVKIMMRDVHDYDHFHRTKLTKLPGVSKISSMFGLRTVVQNTQIFL